MPSLIPVEAEDVSAIEAALTERDQVWDIETESDVDRLIADLEGGEGDLADTSRERPATPQEINHKAQLGRLMRRALEQGDGEARARLAADPDGAKLLDLFQRQIATQSRSLSEADARGLTWFQQQQELYQRNRAEWDRTIGSSPEAMTRYGQWATRYQQLRSGGVVPQQDTGARVAAQVAERLYDRLAASPQAKGLTETDLLAIDPDNFADMDAADAVVAMNDAFQKIVSRKANGPAARRVTSQAAALDQQSQRARDAAQRTPPSLPMTGGRGAADIDVERIREAYRENPSDERIRALYSRYCRPRMG